MKKTDEAAAMIPKAPKPTAAYPAAGATFADGRLVVKAAGGPDVEVPPGTVVYCNGFPLAAEAVPAWLAGVDRHRAKVDAGNPRLAEQGFRTLAVPPVELTLADTDAGPVARFDQKV